MWAHVKNSIASIEPIETMVRGLLGERPQSCSFAGSCPKRMITIDQEGNVVPCSSLVAEEFIFGNVLKEPLARILVNPKVQRYAQMRTRFLSRHCRECEFLPICRGGCLADAFWHSGKLDGEYPYCEARRLTFQYLRTRLMEIVSPVKT